MIRSSTIEISRAKNGREVIVKIAEEKDLKDIFKIIRERRKERAEREREPKIQELTAEEKAWWAVSITNSDPDTRTLLVQLNQNIVGQLTIGRHKSVTDNTVVVLSLDVIRTYRSNGLARMLMNCALSEAKDSLNAELVELWAIVQNTHAVNLYRSVGFQQTGEILRSKDKTWCGQPADRIHMIKHLQG